MKKRIIVALMVVVMAITASVAIYAGINDFDVEPAYVAVEEQLGCCPSIDDGILIAPNNDWSNGVGSISCQNSCGLICHIVDHGCRNRSNNCICDHVAHCAARCRNNGFVNCTIWRCTFLGIVTSCSCP